MVRQDAIAEHPPVLTVRPAVLATAVEVECSAVRLTVHVAVPNVPTGLRAVLATVEEVGHSAAHQIVHVVQPRVLTILPAVLVAVGERGRNADRLIVLVARIRVLTKLPAVPMSCNRVVPAIQSKKLSFAPAIGLQPDFVSIAILQLSSICTITQRGQGLTVTFFSFKTKRIGMDVAAAGLLMYFRLGCIATTTARCGLLQLAGKLDHAPKHQTPETIQ